MIGENQGITNFMRVHPQNTTLFHQGSKLWPWDGTIASSFTKLQDTISEGGFNSKLAILTRKSHENEDIFKDWRELDIPHPFLNPQSTQIHVR